MGDISLDLDPSSPTYGDLLIVDGDLVINSGIGGIQQDILTRLRTYLGEWFLDNTIGMPYFQQILLKNPDQSKIDAAFINMIMGTPGVISLVSYSFATDFVLRTLTVSFVAQTTQGTVDYSGVIPV